MTPPSVDDSDWRLHGQKAYLRGRTLRWTKWWPNREGWDHDHCKFCNQEFCDTGHDGSMTEGYVTANDTYRWICRRCFEDFKDRFSWTVTG
ncbi:MAG: hypothetical protein ACREM3_16595 [Candidatus Rokuibacteriota bacterium]